ncbi:GGDEF domain-containing protein [Paraglaciecola mesophila]|nr:GGDEF domain-containing protein [Paraglaciecola mesophila]
MSLTMMILRAANRGEKYLVDWAIAGIFFISSNILAIFSLDFDLPTTVHPAMGNAFYLAAHAAIYSGINKCINGRSTWTLTLAVFLIPIPLHHIPLVAESVEVRILIFYPMIFALNASALVALWRRRNDKVGKAYWPLMVVLSLFIAQLIIRAVLMFAENVRLEFIGNQFMQTSGNLAIIGFIFLLTISFAIIVFWKKEVTLREASVTDYLTKWLNRSALSSIAQKEYSLSQRTRRNFGFVMFDIDHFKHVNDQHGHATGDQVLIEISRVAKSLMRNFDHCFRLGGEEFAILVSDTNTNELYAIAERIRKTVEQTTFTTYNGPLYITVSIGFALSTDADESWESSLERADKALYHSKETGRNKTSGETQSEDFYSLTLQHVQLP